MNNINQEELEKLIASYNLTPEEVDAFKQILFELNEDEKSVTLNYLYGIDYEEVPVDIDTFVENEDYLGGVFNKGKGIYPYWRDVLRKIFAPDSPYTEIILSGGIGLGKSTIANIGLAYILHHLLCLRRPQRYYGLPDSSWIGIALINLTLEVAYAVGYRQLNDMLKLSPWFLRHGKLKGKKGSESYIPGKSIELVAASEERHTIGRNIFSAFLDEMSFSGLVDPVKARKKTMGLYTNIARRIESRFMVAGKVPGKIFMVSSKNRQSDFLEAYIEANRLREDILIIEEPIWVVKKEVLNLCGDTFKVAVGGRLLPHKILEEGEYPDKFRELGYRLIDVPVEYRRSFESNIEKALNDIAGIATESGAKFMVPNNILKVSGTCKNMFTISNIKIGLKSPYSLMDFFDINNMRGHENSPLYIHLDLSKNGDRTGLAIVTPKTIDKVIRVDESTGADQESVDITYEVLGAVTLEALTGSEIPYYRIKEFGDFLMSNYNVKNITADGFQSLEMTQYFKLKGLDSKVISVDKTPNPYYNLRSAIDEERILVPKIGLLEKEWSELEQGDTMKVDHPYDASGNPAGSKDLSDAICGACWSILNDSETISLLDKTKEKIANNLEVAMDCLNGGKDDDLYDFGW